MLAKRSFGNGLRLYLMDQLSIAKQIMTDFAVSTGLPPSDRPARRYLWTDAFAVCNYLVLFQRTNEDIWLQLALGLVDQVHLVLGRHRDDDRRSGWLSGLAETEGRRHPTRGGLRIGKTMPERGSADP
jgi:hypothetical protein